MPVKGINIQFIDESITSEVYKSILGKKNFSWALKSHSVQNFYLMQDGATPHRTGESSKALFKVFYNHVIGLEYSKFANGEVQWNSQSIELFF